MKKNLILIIITILFIPCFVFAEECDPNSIEIKSISLKDKSDYTEETNPVFVANNKINIDLKMISIDDYVEYNLKIKNTSNETFYFNSDSLNVNSDFFDYTISSEDNSNKVDPKSEKDLLLKIQYKKEVDKDKYIDGKYVSNGDIPFVLSTSKLGINNPLTKTSVSLLFLLVITVCVLYSIFIRKKKKIISILIIGLLIIPIGVYAVCICKVDVKAKIEIKYVPTLNETIIGLSSEENSCITKYVGDVTDEVGKTVPASKVYFDKCEIQRNVIFGNQCWQVIRTTETGGTKMIYNGEPVEGKCEGDRPFHTSIKGTNYSTRELNGEILFGKSFTYDFDSQLFTLIDTKLANIPTSNKRELIDYFTCGNTSNVCDSLIYVGGWSSDTTILFSSLYMYNTDYYDIGSIPFNVNFSSPAMVGYMYNNFVENYTKQRDGTNYMFGSSYNYDESTNTYTLTGNIVNTNTNVSFDGIDSTRFTCWNTTGTCDSLAFIYYLKTGYYEYYHYIVLENGELINDVLNNMINAEDVNKIDSTIKSFIDAWYEHNLIDYTSKIEDTIYCNNRNIRDLGGWNPNGGSFRNSLKFANSVSRYDLSCDSITDQFAIGNDKAKLKYPIALMSNEELSNIGVNSFLLGSGWYWNLSPNLFEGNSAYNRGVIDGRLNGASKVANSNSVRPAISLKNDTFIFSGTGSATDPWIVK